MTQSSLNPKLPTELPNASFRKKFEGLPVTLEAELKVGDIIGTGSFGIVRLCTKNNGEKIILKEMLHCSDKQEKLFIKEARIISKISKFKHENIVQFDSVYKSSVQDTLAFLIEYVYFDFVSIGGSKKIHTLTELLLYLDTFDCKGFEHFQMFIAKDITKGLSFLHDNDVVHRDLKPDNILISNQHYSTSEEMKTVWNLKPIVAKITDFGESRAPLIRTSELINTKTTNICRGTPVYMAPEVFADPPVKFGKQELKDMDIWALLMTFFILINPDINCPFEEEIKSLYAANVKFHIMEHIFKKQSVPKHSDKYRRLRLVQWRTIWKIFETGTSFRRHSITADKILLTLEKNPNADK